MTASNKRDEFITKSLLEVFQTNRWGVIPNLVHSMLVRSRLALCQRRRIYTQKLEKHFTEWSVMLIVNIRFTAVKIILPIKHLIPIFIAEFSILMYEQFSREFSLKDQWYHKIQKRKTNIAHFEPEIIDIPEFLETFVLFDVETLYKCISLLQTNL